MGWNSVNASFTTQRRSSQDRQVCEQQDWKKDKTGGLKRRLFHKLQEGGMNVSRWGRLINLDGIAKLVQRRCVLETRRRQGWVVPLQSDDEVIGDDE